MRPFSRDFPLKEAPKGAMSCDEIRHWMRKLWEDPALGWADKPKSCLANGLGFYDVAPDASLAAKFTTTRTRAWIYPSEQVRLSRQLKLLLAGAVVPKIVGRYPHRRDLPRWAPVLADDPRPLPVRPGQRYDLKRGRLEYFVPDLAYTDVLPSFQTLLSRAQDPKKRAW